ncbi:MAG TPA: hypothetical protein DDX98_11045, partial [Bacteroidales bacterium]|nr:hypothetical protein [Bacteroidales bacterium]
MRIKITLFGLLICIGLSAQNEKRTDIQFDFGTTISIPYKRTVETMIEVEGHPETHYKPGFGYFIEVLLTYNFNSKFGLQSGLNFNQNQLKTTDKIGLRESKGTLNKTYINLPILIRYKIAESSSFTFSGGAYIGILINANQNGVSIIDTANMVLGQENDPAFF